ncbi:hypothetical protein GX51_01843 [Blastomyces parvus]|uniref:Uncharacterized protein n=1 Tax=Blastomyces parvus TaxID=2060905 RepID=A0A2B7XEF4_9EURO|nr:hypothetical protein GX51_01843 [Blastomyces parvus]
MAPRRGDKVIATGRDVSKLVALKDAGATTLRLDVTSGLPTLKEIAKEAHATYGRFDIVVNNAGYGTVGAIEETGEEETEAIFNTNVFGALNVVRAFAPYLRAQGSGVIANISSVAGRVSSAGFGLYCGTKFALSGLSETLTLELAPFGISVICIEPGYFRSKFFNAGHVTNPSNLLKEYDGTPARDTMNFLEKVNNKQPGDPVKGCSVIIDVLTQSGKAAGRPIPSRLALGDDAQDIISAECERTLALLTCWVVVFSPQIIENFRRGSADGLSLLFLIVWLAGDIFNILGAVLQGVLPTMIILAVYYTLADIVLLCQCFYYRGFTLSDSPTKRHSFSSVLSGLSQSGEAVQDNTSGSGSLSEHSPLLTEGNHLLESENQPIHDHAIHDHEQHHGREPQHEEGQERIFHRLRHHDHLPPRRSSLSTLRQQISTLDGAHLSPTMPLIEPIKPTPTATPTTVPQQQRRRQASTTLQIIAFNTFSVALVCAAGVLGWYVSASSSRSTRRYRPPPGDDNALKPDLWGQIFGYLCATLYLGSRIPQLLLNFKRRSTEGVSLLFFLFACVGNLTYVLSIFAYSPHCQGEHGLCRPGEQGAIYAKYIMVNASWLLGSLGTLILDLGIFAQFILYREKGEDIDEDEEGVSGEVVSEECPGREEVGSRAEVR